MLGGQVIAEIDGNNVWQRGYVYAGSNLMAVQQGGVFWMHEDPVTKSKRTTDNSGNVVSAVELDPWGADTNRSGNQAFQPKKYTSYDRDGNGTDEAMFRRYNRKNSRFDQPDPYEGSYHLTDPQTFNRYAYTKNDPVNFVDPSGLLLADLGLHTWTVTVKDGGSAIDDAYLRAIWDLYFHGGGGPIGGREPGGGGDGGGPQNTTPQRNPQCDQKVASIFGGNGAVSTASGFEPSNILNGAYRGDTTGDNGQPVYGHLGSRAMHLYGGDPPGSGTTDVYLPSGYTALYGNPQTLPEYRGGSFVAFYPSLNGLHNVSIIATHVAGFTGSSSDRNAAGSVYIGTTGGRGASPTDNPNYIHSHFELVQGRVVRGRSTTAMPHISFANAFCK